MKKWMKRLASCLLVLALVFPAFSLPETAAAASKITLKSGAAAPSTIYAGHSYTLDVKGANVKYYSSNKKIATIGLTTGKLKATEPGSVKITAKSKKTGKVVATKTFKVLKRSTSVSTEPKTVYLGRVGDTAKLKPTLKPANSTDVIRYLSSDKNIATIGTTSGKITAKGIGKTTIQVYAKATNATSNSIKNNKTTTVDVYVGPYLDQAVQTQLAQVKLTFKTPVEDYVFQPSDFTITNDETKVNCPVKAVSKSSGSKVTLTLYNELRDGKNYTVSNNMSSAKFTATDMQIAGLRIEPTEAEIQKSTQISLVLLDKNGIAVRRCYANNTPSNIDFEVKAEGGYVFYGGMLYLSSMKGKGIARATYHSGKFVNGKEVGNIETGEVIITPLKQKEEEEEPIYSGGSDPYHVQYTVGEDRPVSGLATDKGMEIAIKEFPNFERPKHSAHLSEQSIDAPEGTVRVYFKIQKNGKEVADYSHYTISGSNSYVAEVVQDPGKKENEESEAENNEVQIENDGQYHYITVRTVREGTMYLHLKYDGSILKSLPFTVGSWYESLYPYIIFFDGKQLVDTVEVCNYQGNASAESKTSTTVWAFLRDMYNRMLEPDAEKSGGFGIEERTGNTNSGTLKPTITMKCIGAPITIDAANSPSGNYRFTVKFYLDATNPRRFQSKDLMVRVVKPEVTLQANENYTCDANKDDKDNAAEAFDVYLNGARIPLKDNDSSASAPDAYYTITKVQMSESSSDAEEFQSVTYCIKYKIGKEDDGKTIYETIDCTFIGNELPTITPQPGESKEPEQKDSNV